MNEQAMPDPGGNPDQGMKPADAAGMMGSTGNGDMPQGQGQGQSRKQGGIPEGQQAMYQQAAAQQAAPQMPYPQQPMPQMPYPQQPQWPGYAYAAQPMYAQPGMGMGMGHMHGQHGSQPHQQQAAQPGNDLNQMVQDMTSGTPGLASLTKLIDFNDKDFWKGALVGAAAVLLFTNSGVQRALFRGAVKTRDAAEEGVEKVKEGVSKVKQSVKQAASQENDDE
ncbi:YtxH domain-containing protein [Thiothrix nivea]|uniref:YtxH domain-containing protein n=1 Tax=Thiothrix nivea (strain ATCC 35100 / DSM 5205 / JP2) TaxID=870187 RepID=A0A656HB37_THINJ|nr:YtxH domain-containing protein [Thiothrix nivea]EIJ33567.1 hypothetical protein Thini_0942 [Thiothrix nivea DSM 5205]